jgi:hypothetical protein
VENEIYSWLNGIKGKFLFICVMMM